MDTTPTSLSQIIDCINNKKSFLLEAGAGSGKTWTLVETIKHIVQDRGDHMERKGQQVVCITYTNVAKYEIISRVDYHPLVLVLTIHEFLWFVCKNYQTEIKQLLIEYNLEAKRQIDNLEEKLKNKVIAYTQYGRNLEEGEISHDHVLKLASHLFGRYKKITRILVNKFPFLFIDEYQDTDPKIVDLIFNNVLVGNETKIVVGFFGDAMQKIYNTGIGEINNPGLQIITKADNYRCSIAVINLLSKIRPQLVQKPSGKNLPGEINFVHCSGAEDNTFRNFQTAYTWLHSSKGWQKNDTKVLMLTHKVIAQHQGYGKLIQVYDNYSSFRERLFNKEDRFIKFFCDTIEVMVESYSNKQYLEFINLLSIRGFSINCHADKVKIKDLVDHLNKLRKTATVADVYEFVFKNKLLQKPKSLIDFETDISDGSGSDKRERREVFFS